MAYKRGYIKASHRCAQTKLPDIKIFTVINDRGSLQSDSVQDAMMIWH
ncbi:hypothetical protein SP19_171 [Salmonella phage 19]|nr:hypothetical protein SP19_171 [Salmonella phage 19]